MNTAPAIRSMKRMTVTLVGCVLILGERIVPASCSVMCAITAAGGFAKNPYGPAGIITVRSMRRKDDAYYCRRKFDMQKVDPSRVRLREKDFIIAQFYIPPDDPLKSIEIELSWTEMRRVWPRERTLAKTKKKPNHSATRFARG